MHSLAVSSALLTIILAISTQFTAISSAATDDVAVDCANKGEIVNKYGAMQAIVSSIYLTPSTTAEYAAKCREMRDSIKLLRKYSSKCYKGLTKRVFQTVMRTRSAFNEQHCNLSNQSGKRGFESVKCIHDNSLDLVGLADKRLTVASEIILSENVQDLKLKLRMACCSVVDNKKFVLDSFKKKCANYEDIYSKYLDSYTNEAMSLVCSDIERFDCDKLKKPNYDSIKPKEKFFLNPMLKVVETL